MAKTLRTITVGQLQDLLADEDRDLPVIFSTDYGDRGRTAQALPLRGETEEVLIEESGYSNSGYAIKTDDEDDDPESGEGYETYLLVK